MLIALEMQQKMDQVSRSLKPKWEGWMKLLALEWSAKATVAIWEVSQHIGDLSLVSFSLCISDFQINKS